MKMKLNLRSSAVDEYYKEKSKRISLILNTIEPIESWVLDTDKTIADAIVDLTNVLNNLDPDKISENKEDLLKILAYLSCSKAYFFTTWLDSFQEDLSADFLEEAANLYQESPEFSIHVERMDTIRKMNLLGAVFSEKRMDRIINILDMIKENISENDDYDFF